MSMLQKSRDTKICFEYIDFDEQVKTSFCLLGGIVDRQLERDCDNFGDFGIRFFELIDRAQLYDEKTHKNKGGKRKNRNWILRVECLPKKRRERKPKREGEEANSYMSAA